MKSSSRILLTVFVLGVIAGRARAGGTLAEARQTWLKGNYAEAQEIYAALAKDAKLRGLKDVDTDLHFGGVDPIDASQPFARGARSTAGAGAA